MNLYQEHILDHYHHPQNHGSLDDPTHSAQALNATCGDQIIIDLMVKNDVIADIKFSGEGCAISQASASLLTEHVKDQKLSTLENMTKDDILELLGLDLSPNRLKCGLLSLETAHKALQTKNVK